MRGPPERVLGGAGQSGQALLEITNLLAEYFKFKPAMFGSGEFSLRLHQRTARLFEGSAVLGIELRIAKMLQQLRHLFFKGCDLRRQGFERVLFVEAEAALRLGL